jgi:hypothetical protein
MRERVGPYVIALLLAVILSILPAAIFADLLLPVDNWVSVYWKGHPQPPPQFSLQRLPPALRIEMAVFKALVTPPGKLADMVTGFPTVYSAMFGGNIIYETAGTPPFIFAVQHFKWAFPLWLVLAVATYEIVRAVRRKVA